MSLSLISPSNTILLPFVFLTVSFLYYSGVIIVFFSLVPAYGYFMIFLVIVYSIYIYSSLTAK